jgi:DNA polymerase III epsilon subunit-like protein
MQIDFNEFEKNMIEQGRILDVNCSPLKDKKLWFVYYNGKSGETKVITGSFAFHESGAKSKLKQLNEKIKEGKLPQLNLMVGSCNASFLDFSFMAQKQNSFEDVFKKYPITRHHLTFAKKKINHNEELWNKLSLKNFIVTDTETTGISGNDQVVEIAAIKVRDFKIVDEFQCYVIPSIAITPDAQRVHGLSMDFIRKNGKDAKTAFLQFKMFLEDLPVIGHNVTFDKNKIEYHSSLVGPKVELNIAYDTLQISRKIMQMPDHKLENIIDRLNLRNGLKSHSALDDVKATYRYATILYGVYKSVVKPPHTLF